MASITSWTFRSVIFTSPPLPPFHGSWQPRVLVNDAVRPSQANHSSLRPSHAYKPLHELQTLPGLHCPKPCKQQKQRFLFFCWRPQLFAGSIGHLLIRHSVDGKNKIASPHNGLGSRGKPSPVEKGTRSLLSNGSMLFITWKFNQSVSPLVPPENTGAYPPPRLRTASAA